VFCDGLRVIKRDETSCSSCFSVLGKTLERIAETLTVSAKCDVDTASGLKEYPVHGKLKFTQPVSD